jgi:NADH-quinone oxidoreductase subunit J
MSNPIFWLFALVAVGAAIGMVTTPNAIHSALFLVLNFASIAALYVLLNAPFIAVVQITVYAGAIMVLFLFVIMLLGAERLRGVTGGGRWQRGLAVILALILIVAFAITFLGSSVLPSDLSGTIDTSPTALGLHLFEGYILPFEITGVLLLVAMIGIVILNKTRGGEDA